MLPSPDHMWFAIYDSDGDILDGANGWAIAGTELEAWQRAIEPCEDWSIEKAKALGFSVGRCAVMTINAPLPQQEVLL